MSNQTLINLSKLIPKHILEEDKKKVEMEKKLEKKNKKNKKDNKDYYSSQLNNFKSLEELDKEIENSRDNFFKIISQAKKFRR